jgi:hypothetical protein
VNEDPARPAGFPGLCHRRLVYDPLWSTAPIVGQSYRLEFSPTVGSLNFYTLLGDFRKYIMPVRPFTLAFRAKFQVDPVPAIGPVHPGVDVDELETAAMRNAACPRGRMAEYLRDVVGMF